MDTQTANTVAAAGRAFCFTGRGRKSRSEMAQAVKRRGGVVQTCVTRGTDYLVVGERGSTRWKLEAPGDAFWGERHGRKLARAMQINARGGGIRIVREDAFWRGV